MIENKEKKIYIYDTTLRDGMQSEKINFSSKDKVNIAKRLDLFGMDYIEGGWPGSSPVDTEFFQMIKDVELTKSKIVAFGSTRRPNTTAANDAIIENLLKADTGVVAVFGKSWDMQVKTVFNISLDENLEMIRDTIALLKSEGKEVVFDAEHFFDGYIADKAYAMAAIGVAAEAGADNITLCETNGGCLQSAVFSIVQDVVSQFKTSIGIHCHNDCGLAVASSISAIEAGATLVQGTINGYGERCGNANLCTIMPIAEMKLNLSSHAIRDLSDLTALSRYIDDVANIIPDNKMPFVGTSAFTHKAGVHADAILKNVSTYEHINPESVGNQRKMTISAYSGASNIVNRLNDLGFTYDKRSPEVKRILAKLSELEHEGYSFEEAKASFDLILLKELGVFKPFFETIRYNVTGSDSFSNSSEDNLIIEAILKIVVNGEESLTVAEGDGPVHALDRALRLGLNNFYAEELSDIELTDYKVRVIMTQKEATAAKVRVIIETRNSNDVWNTIGVSSNVIEASWQALRDSVNYGLYNFHKNAETNKP